MKHFGRFLVRSYFVISIVLGVLFVSWLVSQSDDEIVHNVFQEHERLIELGKTKEAYLLFISVLSEQGDGPLDPIWLEIILKNGSGYERLANVYRVLQFAPDQKRIYKQIAKLLESAPEAFNTQVKPRYLRDINAIDGINRDYLKEFNLLEED